MTTEQTSSIPTIGQYWPGQGGIRAGAEIPDKDGRFYDLVVVTDAEHKPVILEGVIYGNFGTEVEGASHFTDGQANATALLATNDSPLAVAAAAVTSCDGQTDCYAPAIGEMNIIRAVCPELLPKVWLLSSSQLDSYDAWGQRFEDGNVDNWRKRSELKAFPVRRVYR